MCCNCEYHKYVDGEWICDNEESENYGLEMEYSDGCVDEVRKDDVNKQVDNIAMWISVSIAVFIGMYITKSPWCLLTFFIPVIVLER